MLILQEKDNKINHSIEINKMKKDLNWYKLNKIY